MQVNILKGIFADQSADLRSLLPVNMLPVVLESGVSTGYLRPADGLVQFASGPGTYRGGISWNGQLYAVMGTKLCRIDSLGTVADLGDVGYGGWVTFDYSFDRLAVNSGGRFYYWNGSTLTQVTDPDLGVVNDFAWIDGYFVTTDGQYIIVTDLTDPTSVNPLKYGSSEADPDPVVAIFKLRNELHAVNRYTVEVFDNVGGTGFPFQRIDGAVLTKGAVGTHAVNVYLDSLVMVGGGRGESPSVWMGRNGSVEKIATREIDTILQQYTEAQLSACVVESRIDKESNLLLIHLPDRCLVFDYDASKALGSPVWCVLTSTLAGFAEYRAKGFVWVYDRWVAGDPTSSNVGKLDNKVSTHYGNSVRWEFGTAMMYVDGNDGIIHEMELCALPGRVTFGLNPSIATSHSFDGETWSNPRFLLCGRQGAYTKRLVWRTQGSIRNYRIQRFQGDSAAHVSFLRLELAVEPLKTRP